MFIKRRAATLYFRNLSQSVTSRRRMIEYFWEEAIDKFHQQLIDAADFNA